MLIYCPKCEAGNRTNRDFCSRCGHPLSEAGPIAEAPAETPPPRGLRRTLSRKSRSIFAICNLAAAVIVAVAWVVTRGTSNELSPAESRGVTASDVELWDLVARERAAASNAATLTQYVPGRKYCIADDTCYEVVEEGIIDNPRRVQLNLSVVFAGTITEGALRGVLSHLHSESADRSGFKHASGLTNLFIYVFASLEHWEGLTWIAMFSEIAQFDAEPRIDIRTAHIAALSEPRVGRFGLSYDQRRRLLKDALREDDRARCEARRIYPDPKPGHAWTEWGLAQVRKKIDLNDRLREEYDARLAESYGISVDELDEVAQEGIKKGWPGPIARDCDED